MVFTVTALVSVMLRCSTASTPEEDKWAPVRKILQVFPLADMAFSAGDAKGRSFTFQKGNTTMTTPLIMASSSKFPASMAIVGVVADGYLGFDTYAREVWPWWSSDIADPRSRVTLRTLLSFTSGFYSSDAGGSLPCLDMHGGSSYTPEQCAKEIHDQAPFEFEPGSTWSYNSFHLQVAGAMAASAANFSVQDMLQKYLIGKLGLVGTYWLGGDNPTLAGAMVTTGDDYDKILRAYVAYEVVPKPLATEMERDYLQPPVKIANSSRFLAQLLGHYSMGNYFECFFPKLQIFSDTCRRHNIHMDAGLFGYYPLVDRAKGMYMQIVQMQLVNSGTNFLPTISAMTLRRLIKGQVDKALASRVKQVSFGEDEGEDQEDEGLEWMKGGFSHHVVARIQHRILDEAHKGFAESAAQQVLAF